MIRLVRAKHYCVSFFSGGQLGSSCDKPFNKSCYDISELEVEKLKREKAKLKLEKEGTYIYPGQRKVHVYIFKSDRIINIT